MHAPVLVTGAAGFAGGHLVERLRHEGRVEGWYRPGVPPPQSRAGMDGVQWRAVDLRDAAAVDEAIADLRPAAVYHLAGAANQGAAWAETDITFELNVRATHVLLRAVERHVPRARVLITTSAAVYAPSDGPLDERSVIGPRTPYGVSKLAQEMLAVDAARHQNLDVVIVRPFNHIGPGQDLGFFAPAFARQIARIEAGLEPGPMQVGNLEPRRDLLDVRDTVRASALLMRDGRRGEIYNVCRGEAIGIGELLDLLRADAAVPVDVQVDPARLRPVDVPLLLGDHGQLTAVTGWRPEIPISRTLHDVLEEQRAAVR